MKIELEISEAQVALLITLVQATVLGVPELVTKNMTEKGIVELDDIVDKIYSQVDVDTIIKNLK